MGMLREAGKDWKAGTNAFILVKTINLALDTVRFVVHFAANIIGYILFRAVLFVLPVDQSKKDRWCATFTRRLFPHSASGQNFRNAQEAQHIITLSDGFTVDTRFLPAGIKPETVVRVLEKSIPSTARRTTSGGLVPICLWDVLPNPDMIRCDLTHINITPKTVQYLCGTMYQLITNPVSPQGWVLQQSLVDTLINHFDGGEYA